MKNLTEEEFYNNFNLIDNHLDDNAGFDGKLYETFGKELDYVFKMGNQNRVLTVIECDNEDTTEDDEDVQPLLYYVTGFHLVNRLGFLILDKPYEFEFEVKID